MIDWLTLRLPVEYLTQGDVQLLKGCQGVLLRMTAGGEVMYRQLAREQIRSDSHSLNWHFNEAEVELYGSPARVGGRNNVFGSDDPVECAERMVACFEIATGLQLTRDWTVWRCTRMDVTENYLLGSSGEVREALRALSASQGGHYRVGTDSSTIYWNKRSRLRAAKAYHKGPHLRYQMRNGQAWASDADVDLCDRLLRLELALRSQFWRERSELKWWEVSPAQLSAWHRDYFDGVIGKVEVIEVNSILETLVAASDGRPGMANQAYNTLLAIRQEGLENVRGRMSRASWHRHKALLFAAGFTWADLQHGANVVQLRRRTIELREPVRSWSELRRAA